MAPSHPRFCVVGAGRAGLIHARNLARRTRMAALAALCDVDACRHVAPEEWYFFSSVPVGTGLVDMPGVVKALKESGYTGVLAVETDHHKDHQDEDKLVAKSIAYLKKLLRELDAN